MMFSRALATLGLLAYVVVGIYWAIRLSEKPTPGFVEEQWSANIRELGISPVFPPREDVQVGDIYLVAKHVRGPERANKNGAQNPTFWLDNLGSAQLIDEVYKKRFALLQEKSDPENGKMWPFVEHKGGVFKAGSDPTRLKNVSFPGFTVASIRSADLAISHPFAAFLNTILGTVGEKSYTVTVSIPYAESYGVPVLHVLKKIDEYCPSDVKTLRERLDILQKMTKNDVNHDYYIEIINEIFYARALDYTVIFQSGGSGEAGITGTTIEDLKKKITEIANSLSKAGESGKISPKTGGKSEIADSEGTNAVRSGTASSTTGTALPPGPALTELEAIRAQLDRLMGKLNTTSVPGASGSVFSADTQSVTMRQTFADPVVIGYRGLTFAVDPQQPASGSLPMFEPCRHPTQPDAKTSLSPGRTTDPAQEAQTFLVFFDWDSYAISPEGTAIVKDAAGAYKAGARVQINVTGYTDLSGSADHNQRLSERRADTVVTALEHLAVPRGNISFTGRGMDDPRVPTALGVREAQNRRVEIHFE